MKGQSSIETIFLSIGLFLIMVLMFVVSQETNIRAVEYERIRSVKSNAYRLSDSINMANFTGEGFEDVVYIDPSIGGYPCFIYFYPKVLEISCGNYRKAVPIFANVISEGDIDNFTLTGGSIRIDSGRTMVVLENV